ILDSAVAHLSPALRDQLDRNMVGIEPNTDTMGTCLLTDVEGFTSWVDEQAKQNRLRMAEHVRHDYREMLAGVVAQHGGCVRDFGAGDSMMAPWLKPEQRGDACRAALAIHAAVERFMQSEGHPIFPTRIGLAFGKLTIGRIGLSGYDTELIGNPANMASRIEAANKDLGTRVLVSEPTLKGMEAEFITRDLGAFLFRGRDEALVVHELMGIRPAKDENQWRKLNDLFAKGLSEFQDEQWSLARERFMRLQSEEGFDNDGPTRFYLRLCERYAQSGPDKNWNGVALKLPLDPSV
ncbi:MAG: adenylate/guanylate cyclase domain-containing protein, partial [Gemmatimonadetes bacterium]|nr:adenylate/guanylate cyclase domain-containing protein [Gemmatimonadota bacterium]